MSDSDPSGDGGAAADFDVPAAVTAAWYRRLSRGALLGIIVLAGYVCVAVPGAFPGLPAKLAELVGTPLMSVAGFVSAWMLTSPEPGNPSWQFLRRWVARAGSIGAVAQSPLRIAMMYLGQAHMHLILCLHDLAGLTGSIAVVAMLWYLFGLAGKIGDRVLKVVYGVLGGLFGFLLILGALGKLLVWSGAVEGATPERITVADWGAGYRWLFADPVRVALSMGVILLNLCIDVRLWWRLRAAGLRPAASGESWGV